MTRDEAVAIIRSSELAADADRLGADLQQSVRLLPQAVQMAMLELGESRLGGCPDLPSGFEWPRCIGTTAIQSTPNEVSLNFIAQICLEDLPPSEAATLLPPRGSLCFFYDCEHEPWGYDPETKSGWRVEYFDVPRSGLKRREHPPVLNELHSAPSRLVLAPEWNLPDRAIYVESGQRDEEWYGAVERLLAKFNGPHVPEEPIHRLLGYAQHVQGDMRFECEFVSRGLNAGFGFGGTFEDPKAKKAAMEWRLLLQIDHSASDPFMKWGDYGRIYYCIRENDLRNRVFDKTWFSLQCT